MGYNFLRLAEEILIKTKVPMTVNEIWQYAIQNKLTEELNSSGKTPWKTLGAKIYVDIKNNKDTKLKQISKIPAKFGIKTLEYKIKETESKDNNENSKYHERDLHALLTKFVYSNEHFRCYTKTIFHEKSKRKSSGVNKWLHPDIVGVHFPYEEYSKETVELINCFNESKYKIYSFEIKKSLGFKDLREYYFQAVSNSSWANEGYLVVLDIDETNEFKDEIRRLNDAFGIGIIKLNAANIEESEILFPAKFNTMLDWNTIDRLVEENENFKEFLNLIFETVKIQKVSKEYDNVLNDEEYEKYIIDKKII